MGVEDVVNATKVTRRGFLGVAGAVLGAFVTSGCKTLPDGSSYVTDFDVNSPEYLAQVRAEIDREVDLSRNLAYIFLDIEKDFGTTQEDYKVIDDLVAKAKERVRVPQPIKNDSILLYIGSDVGRILKDEQGRSFLESDILGVFSDIGKLLKDEGYKIKDTLLLNQGLKTKELDCDLLSVLYATIGEELGLPIYLVNAREHTFVRWVATNGYINWETTSNFPLNDNFYKTFNGITDKSSIEQGVYLKTLTKQQAISLAYTSVGVAYFGDSDDANAVNAYTNALFFDSNSVGTYVNRGGSFINLGLLDSAFKDLTKAMQLDQFCSATMNNMGLCIERMGDINGAVKFYEASLRLNPNDSITQENLDRISKR